MELDTVVLTNLCSEWEVARALGHLDILIFRSGGGKAGRIGPLSNLRRSSLQHKVVSVGNRRVQDRQG